MTPSEGATTDHGGEMNWKDTLHAVGTTSSELTDSLEQLIRAIDSVLEGRLEPELLANVVGGNKGKELIACLDVIGRSRVEMGASESSDQLWSVLRGLPSVIRELSRVLRTASVRLDGHLSVRDGLNLIEQRPSSAPSTTLRCPRCHSRQVRLHTESVGDGRRLVEVACLRCGLSDDRVTEDPTDPVSAMPEWDAAPGQRV